MIATPATTVAAPPGDVVYWHVGLDLTKTVAHDDGTVTVYGRPTSGTVDVDDQIVDPAFMKRALPKWFQEWGNIREMHQPKAVGKAHDLHWDESDQPWLAAHVVDSDAVKKVKAGVLQALSVGIHKPRLRPDPTAKRGRIIDGEVLEVSLVDRPADPDCRVEILKRAGGNAWVEAQTGTVHRDPDDPAWDATPSDRLAPVGPLDAFGNPVLQPGHVQSNAAQISVVTMDDRGIVMQMGPDQYVVPYTVEHGQYQFGQPRRLPTDPKALPDDARGHLTAQEGGVKMAESTAQKRDWDPEVGGGVDRDKIPADDFVDPARRRFPIVKPEDVSDAVHSFGRADPPIPLEHFKRRVEAIARRKGDAFVRALPETWHDAPAEKGASGVSEAATTLVSLVKAAEAALSQRGYCGQCQKSVQLASEIERKQAPGGHHVLYKAECGHEVKHFEAHNPQEEATKGGDMPPSGTLKTAADDFGEAPCEDCHREVKVKAHQEPEHDKCVGVCGHRVKCAAAQVAAKEGVPSGQGEQAEPGSHNGEGQAPDRRIEQQERDIAARMRDAVEAYAAANTGDGGAEEGRENRALAQLKELLDAAISQQQREAIETGDVGAKNDADGHSSDVSKAAPLAAIQKAATVLMEAGAFAEAAALLADVGKAGRRIKRERLDRLKEHHKRLGDLIDELDDEKIAAAEDPAEKAGRPDNDGAAPVVTRAQIVERIRAEIAEVSRLWHEVEDTEGALIHHENPPGNLGPEQRPIAPARKPAGSGDWDLRRQDATTRALREAGEDTRGLYKGAGVEDIATALKAVMPDITKAAAEQFAAVVGPLAQKVEALSHQPMNVTRADLYVAERPTEFGLAQPAMRKVAEDQRASFARMTPEEQRQYAAGLVAAARRGS